MINRNWSAAILIAVVLAGCDPSASTDRQEPLEAPPTPARPAPTASAIANAVDPIIRSALADEGIPGAAFVFVHGDRIVYAQGYGVANKRGGVPVDVERTVWPIASVTKLFTGVAALQLVDSGDLALDQDINRYLRQLVVPAQGYPSITLTHLLSHTGGLDELPGRQFDPDEGPRPSLADFLEGRLLRYRAPGLWTAYSSYGMALVGVAIEDASGLPFDEFIRRRILEPCGMTSARILQRRGDEQGVAVPYEIDDGQATAVPHEWYVTTPTSSLVASAADMARFAMLHLADGRCADKRVLSEHLARSMRAPHATVHPAVPGWGLAFQLDAENGRQLAEHGGDIAGFSSLLTLVPEERSAFFIVNHGESNDLRFRVKRALLDAIYPGPPAHAVPTADPAQAPSLREYQGKYRSSLACHSCPVVGPEQAFEVAVHDDGTLELWGQTWLPVERDLFVRADGERLLGFGRGADGRVAIVSGGSWRVADRIVDVPP